MRRLAAAALLFALVHTDSFAQSAPASGMDVLQRMHDAYAGKWYSTLRFVQKTTVHRPDGTTAHTTWYESLRHTDANGTQLRIDIGDPTAGNGMLYTADSTWVMRGGKLNAAQGSGNVFLPLIEGVYMQPVSKTAAQLAETKIDLSKVTSGRWENRPVWIVGVTSASDSTTPQMWVDQERNIVVRVLVNLAPNSPPYDIQLGDYVKLGDAWLATRIVMLVGGKPRQVEDYADWRVGVELPADMFSVTSWMPARHWAIR